MTFLNDLPTLLPPLLAGTLVTVTVSLLSYLIALVLGMLLALARLSDSWPLRWSASAYIQFLRGTPLLLQLFFIYYVLPYGGIVVSPFVAGILGLSLNYAAYMAEVFRSGINAVPKGQTEAGASLALSNYHIMTKVVLPQALRIVVPPIGNFFVAIFKDSALVSVITLRDLMFSGQLLASSTFKHFEIFAIVAVIYFAISYPSAKLVHYLERYLDPSRVARPKRTPVKNGQPSGLSDNLRAF